MKSIFSRTTAEGQAMLISVLVLGFAALGFVLIGLATSSQASQSALAVENKAIASAAATGCAEQAIERLGLNSAYTGNETLTVGTQSCTIQPISSVSGTWIIETSAHIGDQFTRYKIVLSNRAPVMIDSWNEVASF